MNLTDEVVLITGGSKGLGRAFAEALAQAGAKVAITARSADEINATATQISQPGRPVLAIAADVLDSAGVPQVVKTVEEQLGPITTLINNAGVFRAFGRVDEADPDAWWQEIEINVRGPFLYTRTVLPSMRARRVGRIINVASAAGLGPTVGMSAYGVSKTALIRFSETLAQETCEDGIVVFSIHPGTVRTPMNAYVHDSPEVGQRAPGVQQWFQTLYADGNDNPIEQSVELILRLTRGDADMLSGSFLSVTDDLDTLIEQHKDAIPERGTLRLVR
jgi:NAD(P)-dependent dehydrogenase (short-subunit alcohol dehydrogenase family)